MSYESTLSRDPAGYCKLFGVEYQGGSNRNKWRRCSLTMHDRDAIERNAAELARQERWFAWRVIEVA